MRLRVARSASDIEERLGLTGQPRVIVFHEKEGRRHCHAVWSRITAETMTAIDLPFFKTKLQALAKEVYLENGSAMPKGFANPKLRDARNFSLDEWQQAKRAGIDPRELRAAILDSWKQSDNVKSFAAALGRIKTKIENSVDGITVTKVQQGDGTEAKLHCQYQRAQIKIEVNTIMRGHIFAPRMMACMDKVQEKFEAFAEIAVVSKGELYGGKICAALDRQHPRDLFDVKHLLDDEGLTHDIKQGMIAGLLSHPRSISEVLFPTFKDQHAIFDAQFAGMAFDPFSYDDYEATRLRLNDAVQSALTANDKAFLLSFKAGEPDGVYPLYIRSQIWHMLMHGTKTPHYRAVLPHLS